MNNIKILNVQWFGNVGIVTIDNGFEIKTYIKDIDGFDEKAEIQSIISLGNKVFPEQLEKILSFYNRGKADE